MPQLAIVGAIGAIGSIAGAAIQGNAAKKAGEAQARSVQAGIDVTRQNFLDAKDLIEPQIRMGDRARSALAYELGIGELPYFTPGDLEDPVEDPALSVVTVPGGPRYVEATDRDNIIQKLTGFDVEKYAVGDQTFLTREAADNHLAQLLAAREAERNERTGGGFEYRGFRETPGYAFQLAEGQKAIDRSAAARGMALSGATMKANMRYGQGLANQEYGNYLNRLAAVAGAGQTATNTAFAGYQNNSNAMANLYGAQGNARASSYIGQGNAWSSGISNAFGFLGNAVGGMGGGFF